MNYTAIIYNNNKKGTPRATGRKGVILTQVSVWVVGSLTAY